MNYEMNYQMRIDATKLWITTKYPNANILGKGSNDLISGIWYIKQGMTIKTFTPLMDIL